MNRRLFTATIGAAAIGMITGVKDEWITIADGKPNRKGRTYTEVALQHILETCIGGPVLGDWDSEPNSLEALSGVISDARRDEADAVQVKVRWFGGEVPTGWYLVVCGSWKPDGVYRKMTVAQIENSPTVVGDGYKFECLRLSDNSAFRCATAV